MVELARQLGALLADCRELAGLNQAELGQGVAYDRTTVVHAERGNQIPAAEFWQACDELLQAEGALVELHAKWLLTKEQRRQAAKARARAERRRLAGMPDASLSIQQGETSAGRALPAGHDQAAGPEYVEVPGLGWVHGPRLVRLVRAAGAMSDAARGGADHREHPSPVVEDTTDDELEALELARRVAASDVGPETLGRLEQAVDDLAVAYPGTAPAELLRRVRRHLGYVMHLVDARKNLAGHRRLLVVGSWLSLLGATTHIDLHQWPAAEARLRTAAQMARDVEHPELAAWCLETQAWRVLTDGDYQRAVALAQGAQRVAPRGSSAFIQATAQEGRGWARLGRRAETYDALSRVEKLVAPLPVPDQPEHHYRYDPGKSQAYVATTLSWLGDPAAETHARQVLARLESTEDGPARPRRAASARLDLSLALLASDRADEAGSVALVAVTSGRLVPSNFWRAREVIAAAESRDVSNAAELRDAYETFCRPADPTTPA